MMNPRNALRSPALPGIAVMCLGVACFSVNDAIGKLLTDRYSPLQILFMRNVIALPIALFLALRLQGTHALRSSKPFVHLIRGIFWVLATLLFFTSIKHVGLAKSTALLLTSPLLIVAVAAICLGEKTDRRTWGVVTCGLIGAVIIVRPGLVGFDPLAWLAFLAALMAAFLMLSARWIEKAESFWTMTLYLTAASAIVSAAVVPFFWVPIETSDIWGFAGVAIFGTAGFCLISQAFRMAPAAVVAPLEYMGLLWATLFGWLFWTEVPDLWTFVGATLIISSGIASIVWSESKT